MSNATKIFISSATGKLGEYRQAAIKQCRRYGYEPVFMEDFTPDRSAPENYCRDKVAECVAMILLLAHRYGALVPSGDRSYTELEYDTALDLPHVNIMVWVVDDNLPWLPSEIDQGEAKARLDQLKERARRHTIGTFSLLPKFREDLGVALARLHQSRDHTELSLIRNASHAVQRTMPRPPEVAAFPTYVGNMSFTGRAAETDWLDEWVSSRDAIAVVEAIGGTGKSALTWDWFINSALDSIPDLAGRFWWSFYESSKVLRRFQQVLLIYTTGCSQESAEALDPVALADAVLDALETQPFLIVMDGFERLLNAYHSFDAGTISDTDVAQLESGHARAMSDPAAHHFVRRLASLRRSRIIIPTRLLPDALVGYANVALPGVRRLELKGLRTRETRQLLSRLGVRHGFTDLKSFFDQLDNHPLLIGVVAGLVKNYRRAPGDFSVWLADPFEGGKFTVSNIPLTERRHHILEHSLAGLEPMTLKLLQRISVAGGPVPWDMLQAINPFLPHELARSDDWAELPGYLSDFLLERRKRLREGQLPGYAMALTRLDAALRDLQDRGLLWWNQDANTYDLHPVVRAFAYEGTDATERRTTNQVLVRDHFRRRGTHENPAAAQSVEDLLTTIRYFRALIGAGAFTEAQRLWSGQLRNPLVYRLEANTVVTQMLREAYDAAAAEAQWEGFQWDLAIAESRSGHLESALQRAINILGCWLSEGKNPTYIMPAVNNLITEEHALLKSACAARHWELLTELTELSGNAPGDIARLGLYRVTNLLDNGRSQEAFDLVEQLKDAPPNPSDPNWDGTLVSKKYFALEQLDRAGELEPIEVAAYRFGPALSLRVEWVSFVWQYAERRGDFELAHEAAIADDLWTRSRGRESLPAKIAWSLTELGVNGEAGKMMDDMLTRFDRAHFALRPYYDSANALMALGRDEQARDHALAAYRQAWQDGPPTHGMLAVSRAAALLTKLGVDAPELPSLNPVSAAIPMAVELEAYILQLRDAGAPMCRP